MQQSLNTSDLVKVEIEEYEFQEEVIEFPGGSIQVIETTDGNFWAHICLNRPTPIKQGSRIKAARLDCEGVEPWQMNLGDFIREDLYHIAVLVEPGEKLILHKMKRICQKN